MRETEERGAFSEWLTRYGRAWEEGDSDAVVTLFTADAVYRETPFEEPMTGSDAIWRYWQEGASEGQMDVAFDFTVLSFENSTGIAYWRASFKRVQTGASVALDGILMAEFARDGRCQTFREWWHRKEE